MPSKCWLTWLPNEKDSSFHAEFYKQKGLDIKEICWEEKKSLSLWSPKLLNMSREEEARKAAYEWRSKNFDKINMPSDEFVAGVQWGDSHHWYPCDGDYLPDFDEVVLVTLIWEDSEGEESSQDVTFTHRSDNPNVWVDENGFALITRGAKYGSWCRIPKFTKK